LLIYCDKVKRLYILRGMKVERTKLWEEIEVKKQKLDELIDNNNTIKNTKIINTSQKLDELITKFYENP